MTTQLEVSENPNYIPLLDHGFVGIIDHMGSDASIVRAARVSYGAGTKTVNEDRGLIRYLMRHSHSSPVEMAEFIFHIKIPIFVARQLVRHRTACLAGDTILAFDLPSGKTADVDAPRVYPLSVKQIFERWHTPDGIVPCEVKRNRIRQMQLRSCDEENLMIYRTNVTDIWENGIKPILKVIFPDGDILRATRDHLCFTEEGWMRLEDALQSDVGFARFVRQSGFVSNEPSFSKNELHLEQWKMISDRMLTGCDQKLTIAFEKAVSFESDGDEMTYDLSVKGPYHNFSAANTVVHNSMNEYSGRYSIMSDEFYLPDLEHIQPQSETNKQGRAGDIDEPSKHGVRWLMQTAYEHSYKAYDVLLGEREGIDDHYDPYAEDSPLLSADFPGIARESARAVLPVANYTECYWKCDLSNLFKLIKLRSDAHAQYEIRVLSDAILKLIEPIVPHACEAARDYLFEAQSLSRMDVYLIKAALTTPGGYATIEAKLGGEKETAKHYGMSPRELRELKVTFNLDSQPRGLS